MVLCTMVEVGKLLLGVDRSAWTWSCALWWRWVSCYLVWIGVHGHGLVHYGGGGYAVTWCG